MSAPAATESKQAAAEVWVVVFSGPHAYATKYSQARYILHVFAEYADATAHVCEYLENELKFTTDERGESLMCEERHLWFDPIWGPTHVIGHYIIKPRYRENVRKLSHVAQTLDLTLQFTRERVQ
jgi:hypothetical protein